MKNLYEEIIKEAEEVKELLNESGYDGESILKETMILALKDISPDEFFIKIEEIKKLNLKHFDYFLEVAKHKSLKQC